MNTTATPTVVNNVRPAGVQPRPRRARICREFYGDDENLDAATDRVVDDIIQRASARITEDFGPSRGMANL